MLSTAKCLLASLACCLASLPWAFQNSVTGSEFVSKKNEFIIVLGRIRKVDSLDFLVGKKRGERISN